MSIEKLSGLLILVLGPSGVGKGTLLKRFVERHPSIAFVLSHTTRQIREGEVDGVTRYFVSEEQFMNMRDAGEFLEWAKVYGMEYYGTAKSSVLRPLQEGKVIIKELDVQGLEQILLFLGHENVFSVFVVPDDVANLRLRIEGRGQLPEAELKQRLEAAQVEIEKRSICDYVLVNRQGEFDAAYAEFERVVMQKLLIRGLKV